MKKMLGAVFEGDGRLTVREVSAPQITSPDDVVIKVEGCGICGTDVSILSVPPRHPVNLNTILGHEFVGHVSEVGTAVDHVRPGDRVTVAPNLACGVCQYCLLGMLNQCLNLTSLGVHIDGGFAEYVRAQANAVLPLSSTLPLNEAVFIEPLSCVYAGTSKIAIQPGETAVVLGSGPIGLIFTSVFKASGAGKIIATDIEPFRLEYARKAGADVVVDPGEADLEAVVREEMNAGAHVVVDAVGSLADEAARLAARQGRVCLFGYNAHARPTLEQGLVTQRELTIFGTFVGANMIPHAVRILGSGVLSLSALLTHSLPLSDIHEGFAAIRDGTAIKVMIIP